MCTERVLFSFRKMPGDAWQWRRVRKKNSISENRIQWSALATILANIRSSPNSVHYKKIVMNFLRFLLHEQLVVHTPNIPLNTSEVSRIRNEFEHKCSKICASEVKNMPIAFRADVEITCICVMELNETEFCAVSIILHLYRR